MNKSRRAKAVVYASLIFLGGLATGLFVAPLLGRAFFLPPSPEQMSQHLLSMLKSRLELTPEQTAQIKPILDKNGEDLQGIWLDTTGRVSARIDETNSQIAKLLTEEQKAKLEKLTAEGRERMRGRIPFAPPHRP